MSLLERIAYALQRMPDGADAAELARELGDPAPAVRAALRDLKARGLVERPVRSRTYHAVTKIGERQ